MLTSQDLERYQRQILYDGFGEEGQRKLKQSHVVLVNGIEVPPAAESLEREVQEGDEAGVGMMHFWGGG